MKSWFFTAIMVLIPVGLFLGLLYMLGHGIYSLLSDWQTAREVDEIQSQSEARREKREQANAERLNNDCEHQEDTVFGVFPPGVCCKCGLALEKPGGPCDHVWRQIRGPVPYTQCEKCGRKYTGTESGVL